MDDFILSNLNESKNEWSERLISILVPHIHEGVRSIYIEAIKLATKQNEPSKYLMTFQSLLCNIPNWNAVTLKEEVDRIVDKSGCSYISDLIACVHIIQLKILTCMKVNQKYKKMDISIPKLELFIHGVYVHVARELYKNAYLFERNVSSLQEQKNHRCIELIIRHCILKTMRDSIPTEQIVKAYLDESIEPVVEQEEIIIDKVETGPPPPSPSPSPSITNPHATPFVTTAPPPNIQNTIVPSTVPPTLSIANSAPETLFTESNPMFSSFSTDAFISSAPSSPSSTHSNYGGIKFDDNDYVLSPEDEEIIIEAPKTDEYINERNELNRQKSQQQQQWINDSTDDDSGDTIRIHSDKPVEIDALDIYEL